MCKEQDGLQIGGWDFVTGWGGRGSVWDGAVSLYGSKKGKILFLENPLRNVIDQEEVPYEGGGELILIEIKTEEEP